MLDSNFILPQIGIEVNSCFAGSWLHSARINLFPGCLSFGHELLLPLQNENKQCFVAVRSDNNFLESLLNPGPKEPENHPSKMDRDRDGHKMKGQIYNIYASTAHVGTCAYISQMSNF